MRCKLEGAVIGLSTPMRTRGRPGKGDHIKNFSNPRYSCGVILFSKPENTRIIQSIDINLGFPAISTISNFSTDAQLKVTYSLLEFICTDLGREVNTEYDVRCVFDIKIPMRVFELTNQI